MDLAAHKVSKGGVPIELTSREFRVLEYLMRNKGRVVTRSMILEAVWDYNFDPHTNVIDQYIRRIRQKLNADNGEEYIHTVRGAGYGLWNE
jgi:two-component system, OmpR family, response regulator